MTAPPFFADLGKNARDVITKGYFPGLLKLDVKTATDTGVSFVIGGALNFLTQKTVCSLETKYKFQEYGVVFMERWNTDNILQTEIAAEDFCKGARVACETTLVPKLAREYDDKRLKLRGEFKSTMSAFSLESDFKSGGPVVQAGAVLGFRGSLLGVTTTFDTESRQLPALKFALGFTARDYVIHSSCSDRRLEASIYHSVYQKLETALSINWPTDGKIDYTIGCRYAFQKEAVFRLKINSEATVSAGISNKLRDGVTVSLSLQMDCKEFLRGAVSAGCSLELEG